MAVAAPSTEVWHSHYDDPNGDLVLESSDGIKLRTYSGLIAKTTSFFKPMNGVILPPSDSADRKPHVVKLDYESTIIVHFLDCASVSSPILSTEFDDSVKLLGLADQLQAEKLVNLVKQHLGQKIKDGHRAADLLLSASTRDDWALGRAAIRKLNQNTIEELNRQPGGYEGFFDKLRPVWRQNLMKLVLFQMLRDVGPHWMGWTGLAGRFVAPDRNTEKRRSSEEDDAPPKRIKPEEG